MEQDLLKQENSRIMDKKETREVFLVTTALEDFWDTSKDILFLGEWCKRYSRRDHWKKLRGETMPYVWGSWQEACEAYEYTNGVCERLSPLLSKALNRIHGLNYSRRYWKILIWAWISYYVSTVYEKYSSLRKVLQNYPDITTAGLSEECFVVARDTMDFVQYLKEDTYHLQLFTRILNAMGCNFPRKKIKVANRPFSVPTKTTLCKHILRIIWKHLFTALERQFPNGKTVILKDSSFSRWAQLQFILFSRGKIWESNTGTIELPLMPVNSEIRSKLSGLSLGESEFEKILMRMLPLDIPQSYIESYALIKEFWLKKYPKKIKAIFSANAWYFDEALKQWAAESAEQGTLLFGAQHGGNYGSASLFTFENFEIAITDRFYSWGWNHPDHKSKVIPMPAPYLLCRKSLYANNNKRGILLGAGMSLNYFIGFPYLPVYFTEYLNWQISFLRALAPKLRTNIRIRLHAEELNWDISERLKTNFPKIILENWDTTFSKSLENCRLYVCDNLLTTFIEALSANKPTVLFWNPQTNVLRPEAKPYYDMLKEAGILYYNPQEAASVVNSVYNNVEKWWNDPKRQLAQKEFCDRFAKVSRNGIREWLEELKRISRK